MNSQSNLNSSNKAKLYINNQGYCILEVDQKKDSTWTFGFTNESEDSIVLIELIKYSQGSNEMSFCNKEMKLNFGSKDFKFNLQSAENDYYQDKFPLLSYRFLYNILLFSENKFHQSINPKVDGTYNFYKGIKYFVDNFQNDSLSFLKNQLSLIDSSSIDFYNLTLNSFNQEDYEKALFYSKLFLLNQRVSNAKVAEISRIYDDSNIAVDIQSEYAFFNDYNNVIPKKLFESINLTPKTTFYSEVWW